LSLTTGQALERDNRVYIDAQELLLLRLEAMRSVLRKDADYWLRYICRWYSEHYSTPLHEVGTPSGIVPLRDACHAFYEVYYKDLNEADREHEIELLTQTPEEERQANLAKDIVEAENWQFARNVERNLRAKEAREKAQAEKQRLEQVKMREQGTMAPEPQVPPGVLTPKPITRDPELVDNGPRKKVVPPSLMPAPAQRSMETAPKASSTGAQQGNFDLDTFTLEGKDAPQVKTQLPPDVKVVFMTDEEMEKDIAAQDPFSVEKPRTGRPKRKKPPQSKS
jgi:hypothetical protein